MFLSLSGQTFQSFSTQKLRTTQRLRLFSLFQYKINKILEFLLIPTYFWAQQSFSTEAHVRADVARTVSSKWFHGYQCNRHKQLKQTLTCVLFCLLAKQSVNAHQSTNQNMFSQPQLTVSQEPVIRVHVMELKRFKRLQECGQGTGKGIGVPGWMQAPQRCKTTL